MSQLSRSPDHVPHFADSGTCFSVAEVAVEEASNEPVEGWNEISALKDVMKRAIMHDGHLLLPFSCSLCTPALYSFPLLCFPYLPPPISLYLEHCDHFHEHCDLSLFISNIVITILLFSLVVNHRTTCYSLCSTYYEKLHAVISFPHRSLSMRSMLSRISFSQPLPKSLMISFQNSYPCLSI